MIAGIFGHLIDDRNHRQRAHSIGRRQLVNGGKLRRPVRRRIELGAELVGGQIVVRRLEAVLFVSVRLLGFRIDRRSEFRRRKAPPHRDRWRKGVCQIDVLGSFKGLIVDTPEVGPR